MVATLDTKPFFQRRLRPATRVIAGAGITANQVTVASMALSTVAGAAVLAWPEAAWPLVAVCAVLLVRVAFNHIDGMLAREHGMATPLGGILNELGDVVCDAALYLPLAVVPGMPAALIVALVMLGVISEMTGVAATTIGARRRNDGPMAKKPRGVVFGSIALAVALGAQPGPWIEAALIAALVLQASTVVIRTWGAVREVAPS